MEVKHKALRAASYKKLPISYFANIGYFNNHITILGNTMSVTFVLRIRQIDLK